MEKYIWIFISLLLFLFLTHFGIDYINTRETTQYTKKFHYDQLLDQYPQAAQRFYAGEKKPFKKAVLLLHGYSASPQEFSSLYPLLEKAKIPYYAPQLLGFGLGHLHLLKGASWRDSLRDALNAYDLLASLAEEVDVVGHSNGATLAMLISQHRAVDKLVLSSPYFGVPQKYQIYKEWLQKPMIQKLAIFLIPVYLKPTTPETIHTRRDTLNQTAAKDMFHYPALPSKSLLASWKLQDQLNILQSKAKSALLLYGRHDTTSPIQDVYSMLKKGKFNLKIVAFPKSGHNLYEDYDKEKVNQETLIFLQGIAQEK